MTSSLFINLHRDNQVQRDAATLMFQRQYLPKRFFFPSTISFFFFFFFLAYLFYFILFFFHFSYFLFFLAPAQAPAPQEPRQEPRQAPRQSPVHGSWGPWQPSNWNSAPCSGGKRTRWRYCNSPYPAHGGTGCSGSSTWSSDCNECASGNGGCQHLCINSYGSYRCLCYSGYKPLTSNWKRCESK